MEKFIIYDRVVENYKMNFMERYIPIFILIIILAIIFIYRRKIRGNIKADKVIRGIILSINIAVTITYYIGRWIYIGVNADNIPLHLCYLCNILSIIILLNKNKKIYGFLLFSGLIGGISSLTSMDVTLSSKHLKYYYFMVAHISIIIVPLYFSFVYKYRLKSKDIINSFIYIQILGILMGIINYYFKSNYFFVSFTSNIAAKGTILEGLGQGYEYFLKLEILSIIYLCIWLIINKIFNYYREICKFNKKRESCLNV